MLFNFALTFAVHCVNSFVPAFFKFCNDHLFDNLESEKRNYRFRKNSGKSLEFYIQKSVLTLLLASFFGFR